MASPFDLNRNQLSPFGAKKFVDENGVTRSLFKRVHGIESPVVIGNNDILYVIPYSWAKITAIEIIDGENGDKISLFVLDSLTGTYTTIPNYELNQFGFNVNVAKDYYSRDSKYDADLKVGMQVKIVYTSVSIKTARLNLDLDEVV